MADGKTSAKMEHEKTTENDGFVKVKSRKRKSQTDGDSSKPMETSESAPKRPNLPPISGEKLTVRVARVFLLTPDPGTGHNGDRSKTATTKTATTKTATNPKRRQIQNGE